jgi:hypothetical protein
MALGGTFIRTIIDTPDESFKKMTCSSCSSRSYRSSKFSLVFFGGPDIRLYLGVGVAMYRIGYFMVHDIFFSSEKSNTILKVSTSNVFYTPMHFIINRLRRIKASVLDSFMQVKSTLSLFKILFQRNLPFVLLRVLSTV